MKRTLRLVLACVCLLAFLITECSADCSGGSRLGQRVQSGLSKIVGVPKKINQAVQAKKASCSGAASAMSCSAPSSSCSAPQVAPVEFVAPVFVPVVTVQSVPQDCSSGTCTVQESARSFQPIRSSIAQHKANVQAGNGVMRHIGGSFGAGRFEGVGFSTVSADDAIRQCCYWGQRTPVDIGVARGQNGWFATVLYQ